MKAQYLRLPVQFIVYGTSILSLDMFFLNFRKMMTRFLSASGEAGVGDDEKSA